MPNTTELEPETFRLGATMVSGMVVVLVMEPEVPVIVMVELPVAAAALAVNTIWLEYVVGLVPKVAVTPDGRPLALKVTFPLNPNWLLT
jgi:hypothetical protein